MNPAIVAISVAIFATSVLGDHYGDHYGDYYGDRKYKPVDCGDLHLDYGKCKISWTPYGKTAKCYCYDGYRLYGDSTRKCHNGYWGGKEATCKKDCDNYYLDYGKCDYSYTPYKTAKCYCDYGYRLYGDSDRKCHDGYWDGKEPKCKKDCDDYHLDYGKCDYSYTPYKTAKCYCNYGYQLYGDSDRKCHDGYWGGKEPKCKKDCDDYHLDYGKCDYSYTPYKTAKCKCDYGYQLYGDSDRKCHDGYWGGKEPKCKKIYPKVCKKLSHPDYGWVKAKCRYAGCTASYSCRKGYKLYGDWKRKCLYSGYWDGDKPVCKRVRRRCPKLYDPDYGSVDYGHNGYGYGYDAVAYYKCDYGYKLKGDSKRVCRKGYWLGRAPRCVKKKYYY